MLGLRLRFKPGVVVTAVPYHINAYVALPKGKSVLVSHETTAVIVDHGDHSDHSDHGTDNHQDGSGNGVAAGEDTLGRREHESTAQAAARS